MAFAPRGAARAGIAALTAAGAFAVARFYTFDPYFAPSLRRMSEGGMVVGTWIVALLALVLGTVTITLWRPAFGLRAASVVLLLCGATAAAEGLGH